MVFSSHSLNCKIFLSAIEYFSTNTSAPPTHDPPLSDVSAARLSQNVDAEETSHPEENEIEIDENVAV